MDYRYQLYKIQELNVGLGQSYRGDCVFCLNRNTLSVRHENGRLVWNCFHANCTAKGMTDSELRAEDLDKFINPSKTEPSKEFVIPKHFVTVFGNNKAREYLESFGITDTEARLMYDVKQSRLVFLVEDNGMVVGAVGRVLCHSDTAPKWYKYGTPPVPFIVGTNKYIGFIVEDCISACKVALAGFTGIALMGTSIPDNFVSPIVDRIDRAFVCLDRDATEKSFKLRDCLSHVIPTQIKMIDKDFLMRRIKRMGK